MIILTIILLFAVALVCVVCCIGAAMAYEDNRRPFDGNGSFICGVLAIVFAAVGGALLGPLL